MASFKRITCPPTGGNPNIDISQLKKAIARGNLELERNVTRGSMPVFGYPVVHFEGSDDYNEHEGLS